MPQDLAAVIRIRMELGAAEMKEKIETAASG
jgi:hypothetical protein